MTLLSMNELTTYRWSLEQDVENYLQAGYRAIGLWRQKLSDWDEDEAIALVPDSAEAHNLMGVLHELRNEHDSSYREYKAALKADKRYEPARHNMTRYYERFTFGRSAVPIDTGDD